MVPIKIMEKIAKDFDLSKEELIEESLKTELRRRLATYKFTDYLFSKKYKMSLNQFEKKKMIAKNKFSLDIEEDYHNWDQAIDGIKTLEKNLELLEKA